MNTTDIHSKVDDTVDEYDRRANMLRLSTALNRRKSILGYENVLLIDCGDLLQGSFPAMLSNGEFALNFLFHNSYDVFVPGNHDFDFGLKRFEELFEKTEKVTLLAMDLKFKKVSAWKIFEINGLKVAVIGSSLPSLEFFNMEIGAFRIGDFDDMLDKIIPEIMREQPSAIIIALHQGIYTPFKGGRSNLAKIANKYPQINLFLGGHTHEENPGQKIGPTSWFVQAGSHAKTFAEIEMLFDDTGCLLDIKSKLIDVNDKYEEDKILKEKISAILDDVEIVSKKVIGETFLPIPTVAEGVIDCEIRELISQALCEATGTKIAFSGCGTRSANLLGKITNEEIFNLLPYEDNVCSLKLSVEQFKAIINEQMSKFDQRHFNMPWGIRCEFDKDKKLLSLKTLDGDEWFDGKRTVAFSSFALSGAGGRFPLLAELAKNPDCEFRNSKIKVRDAVISFINKNSPIKIKTSEWLIFEKK